jgi:hypothetical protein
LARLPLADPTNGGTKQANGRGRRFAAKVLMESEARKVDAELARERRDQVRGVLTCAPEIVLDDGLRLEALASDTDFTNNESSYALEQVTVHDSISVVLLLMPRSQEQNKSAARRAGQSSASSSDVAIR